MSTESNPSQTESQTKSGLNLPGFGLPVNARPAKNWGGNRTSYPNAVESWSSSNMTVREIKMLAVMNELSDKPDWEKKVLDESIVAKWKTEALTKGDFTEKMFDYCIKELRDKAAYFSQTGRIYVIDDEAAVVKSDTAIPSSLTAELIAAVKPLEDVPARLKDWHPQSSEKVLDLVHPSLYPLMYGKSRVLSDKRITLADCLDYCGKGVVIPKPDMKELDLGSHGTHMYNGVARSGMRWGRAEMAAGRYFSGDYQWLPCEVAFKSKQSAIQPKEGNEVEVEITSYINNLHPVEHKQLYTVLEKVIAKTIPMWNDTLSYLDNTHDQRIPMECTEYEWPNGTERPKDNDDDEEGDDEWERNEQWERANRVLVRPEPTEYKPHAHDPLLSTWKHVNLAEEWHEEGLQIIVKLANIELTPEGNKTEYSGGSWHVEGVLNEHICASAIYYYDQENVTDSRLAFRQLTSHEDLQDKTYGQDDYSGVEELYGIQQYGPCVQNLGAVLTRKGRLVAFPNVLQHQVQPFKLADPTRPGYRKILALFLVDPYVRTLSTANIPPQQRSWWADSVHKNAREEASNTRLKDLPPELMEKVVSEVDGEAWPISLEEAKKVRLDLMAQRAAFVGTVNQDYEQEGFSFCEH